MEEASQRASKERTPRIPLPERARLQRLESLIIAVAHRRQLSKAVRPAHRQMLMKALQAIEEEADEISQIHETTRLAEACVGVSLDHRSCLP